MVGQLLMKNETVCKNDTDDGDKLILDTAKYVLENDEFKRCLTLAKDGESGCKIK